jgi:predicted phosphodiesterase
MFRKFANRFCIQYTSDLHLERYVTQPAYESILKPAAPYLALAGDIGHPQQLAPLFAWAAPQWDRIFYVAGNHEYYGASYEERFQELQELVKPYENLHFLHPSSPSFFCEAENVTVVGSTLWSEVSPFGAWKSVADYKAIQGATVENLNVLHRAEKAALASEIRAWTDKGAQICAITHHLPSFRLIHPRFAFSTVNDCFASASDALLRPPVRLWIYGHSHACSHKVINKVLCVSNAKGYEEERVTGWRNDVWMEFPFVDPQEAEAVAKVDQTPLRTSTYLEDSEITFM